MGYYSGKWDVFMPIACCFEVFSSLISLHGQTECNKNKFGKPAKQAK